MKIVCPNCSAAYDVEESFAGEKVECASCETVFEAAPMVKKLKRTEKPVVVELTGKRYKKQMAVGGILIGSSFLIFIAGLILFNICDSLTTSVVPVIILSVVSGLLCVSGAHANVCA